MNARGSLRVFLICLLSHCAICPDAAVADPFRGWGGTWKRPKSCLEKLAVSVDKLEREIDTYGSVVVKQPDIWGEARWTKHRQDYEKVLKAELEHFRFTINAQISEADSAFLLNALTLAGASSGQPIPDVSVQQVFNSGQFPQPQFADIRRATIVDVTDPKQTVTGVTIEPTLFLDQLSRYVKHLNHLRRINEGDDTADAPGYALNLMRLPVSVLPGKKTRTGYGAEVTFTLTPELSENLLPDTFKDLVVNDLIDQLSLPLVKLAERQPWNQQKIITQALEVEQCKVAGVSQLLQDASNTADPDTQIVMLKKVGERAELLVGTDVSKNLDGVPQSARDAVVAYRSELRGRLICKFAEIGEDLDSLITEAKDLEAASNSQEQSRDFHEKIRNHNQVTPDLNQLPFDQILQGAPESIAKQLLMAPPVQDDLNDREVILDRWEQVNDSWNQQIESQREQLKATLDTLRNSEVLDRIEEISAATKDAIEQSQDDLDTSVTQSVSVSSPRAREARYAVPPTLIACVFGEQQLLDVAQDLLTSHATSGRKQIHLFDAEAFLREELEAAYQMLATLHKTACYDAWSLYCPRLAIGVRQLQFECHEDFVANLRRSFYADLDQMLVANTCKGATTRALAWAILVESALLNERLHEDIHRISVEKGSPNVCEEVLQYYGPNPGFMEREIFNEYVRQRWPIHVFAIDPTTQEQNVADAYTRRRETQLALAVAFANGEINANNFTRYSRRLDFELETVSLNRTVVGFSHGNETFGWRIYPRVQAPPTPGTLGTIHQLLHGGTSRDDDLKDRQLEAGPRELLAIVLMPSFIPNARLDMRSNWFHLTKPQRKQFTTEDSIRLGQMMQYVRVCKTQCLHEENLYRPGDIRRVMNAVDQLEERLPLQDAAVQVPYENTLGGFQLFAMGTRNLGPELLGFYGEPGVNTKGTTNLFLVGRGFNVNVTEVIIGGHKCEYDLLSREIMRVAVPKDANTTKVTHFIDGKETEVTVVDAHVATPYGVTSHIDIPVVAVAAAGASFTFDPDDVFGCISYSACAATNIVVNHDKIKIKGDKKLAGKVADVTISVNALLSTGIERELTYTKLKDGKLVEEKELKFPETFDKDGALVVNSSEFSESYLLPFVGTAKPLLAAEGAIALKVSGKVKPQGGAETSITGTLLIKLACQPMQRCCNVPWDCPTCPIFPTTPPQAEIPRIVPPCCNEQVPTGPEPTSSGQETFDNTGHETLKAPFPRST
ncbi:MAG: hypothetical protein KDA93_20925 [Planctomycetaceae bacterium]|nr:hypothetical protein [Planctomycetaceae bacterium]